MNQDQKRKKNNELAHLLEHNCIFGSRDGYVNIVKQNSLQHELCKAALTHWLKKNGYTVFSEPVFINGGGKPDIIAIQNGQGFAIEVLHSESEKRFTAKFDKYDKNFTIVRVDTKTFDYDTFCL